MKKRYVHRHPVLSILKRAEKTAPNGLEGLLPFVVYLDEIGQASGRTATVSFQWRRKPAAKVCIISVIHEASTRMR